MGNRVHYIEDASYLRDIIPLLMSHTVLAVDTETRGLDPYQRYTLRSVQICTPDGEAYVVNTAKVDGRPLKPVLEHPAIKKLGHNISFDYKMLAVGLGIQMTNMADTMIMERLLTVGLTRELSLKVVAEKHLGEKLDKEVRKGFIASIELDLSKAEIEYAARDTSILFPLYDKLYAGIVKEQIIPIFNLECTLIPVVAEIELVGVKLDAAALNKVIDQQIIGRDRVAAELEAVTLDYRSTPTLFGTSISGINFSSPKQVLDLMREMGITATVRTHEGEEEIELPNTSDGFLVKIDHPFVKLLLKYREYEKKITVYGTKLINLINPVTGRVHPSYQTYGATSGRMSSDNPNLQQTPHEQEFRSCFVARPGYKIISLDYSNIEVRLAAEFSRESVIIDALNNDTDMHKLSASKIFNIPMEQVTKDQRAAGKLINFSSMYGAGPGKISSSLEIPFDQAVQLLDAYWKGYPNLKKWLESSGRQAVDKGAAVSISGRKVFFPQMGEKPVDPILYKDWRKLRGSYERQAANFQIQSVGADMMKLSLIHTHNNLRGYDARIIGSIHDEIVIECREDLAQAVAEMTEYIMVKVGERYLKAVACAVEYSVEDYWKK